MLGQGSFPCEKEGGGSEVMLINKCIIDNCNNIKMSKGRDGKGRKKYKKLCSTHYKLKQGRIHSLNILKCSICHWEGPCDKHRIVYGVNGGRYISGNVVILCPNCHRLLHMGKLFLK